MILEINFMMKIGTLFEQCEWNKYKYISRSKFVLMIIVLTKGKLMNLNNGVRTNGI
jgi:hypothetical protein